MVRPAPDRVNEASARNGGEPGGDEPRHGAGPDDVLLEAVAAALGYRGEALRGRRAGPRRRLRARVSALGLEDRDYVLLVGRDAEESARAERLLLVHRPRLFRDPALWERLRVSLLPDLAARAAGRGREARLWCAGDALGAEAMSLAVLWREVAPTAPVRILATAACEACLRQARSGWYPGSALRDAPPRLAASFRPDHGGFVVNPEARALIAFAVHDLGRDPWPRELDLVHLRSGLLSIAGTALAGALVERAAASLVSHRFLSTLAGDSLPLGAGGRFVHAGEAGVPLYRKRT